MELSLIRGDPHLQDEQWPRGAIRQLPLSPMPAPGVPPGTVRQANRATGLCSAFPRGMRRRSTCEHSNFLFS